MITNSITEKDTKKKKVSVMDFLFKSINISVPRLGDVVDGKIIVKHGQRIFVDLGPFSTGIIYGREFLNARDILKPLKIGDSLSAKVVDLENEDGYIELSLREAKEDMIWGEAKELMDKRTPIDIVISDANKGGLVVKWNGVNGFLPTSQLRTNHYPRVEGGDKNKILDELKKLVNQTLTLTIITADPKEEKLIFSEKSTESDELRKIVSKYKVGDIAEGPVTGVVDFGIFIKLEEGLEGLAHISELDWSLVESPADLFSVGDIVKAKVIGVDGGKVSLSVKALTQDPWAEVEEKFKKGDIIEGEVVRFNQYGALVCLLKGVCGLVHISEFSSDQEMKTKLVVNKKYPFQITLFEPKDHKLTFSFLQEGVEAKVEEPSGDEIPTPEGVGKDESDGVTKEIDSDKKVEAKTAEGGSPDASSLNSASPNRAIASGDLAEASREQKSGDEIPTPMGVGKDDVKVSMTAEDAEKKDEESNDAKKDETEPKKKDSLDAESPQSSLQATESKDSSRPD